jgi:hypothetical protein
MLDVGFESEVSEVVRACPSSRQTLLFSATITSNVAKLATLSLEKPLQVKVDPIFNVADSLQQEFVRLRPSKEHEREAVRTLGSNSCLHPHPDPHPDPHPHPDPSTVHEREPCVPSALACTEHCMPATHDPCTAERCRCCSRW